MHVKESRRPGVLVVAGHGMRFAGVNIAAQAKIRPPPIPMANTSAALCSAPLATARKAAQYTAIIATHFAASRIVNCDGFMLPIIPREGGGKPDLGSATRLNH